MNAGGDDSGPGATPPNTAAAARGARLSDRTLWILLAVGVLAVLAAIGFAVWINAAGPLHPVPVASRPSV